MKPPEIRIIGAGSVGLALAGLLIKGGFQVTLACRRGGFCIDKFSLRGARTVDVAKGSFRCCCIDQLSEGDCVYILSTKAYDIEEALGELSPILTSNTPVALASNGLNIYLQARTLVERRVPLLRLLVNFGTNQIQSGTVEIYGEPKVSIAAPIDQSTLLDRLEGPLKDSGVLVEREKDIATAEWKKLLVNLVVNPIGAILDTTNDVVVRYPEVELLASNAFHEVRTVAKKDGFDLSSLSDETLLASIREFGGNINSTLSDLRRGHRTEYEYTHGRFLRLAQDYGMPVPTIEGLSLMVRALEARGTGTSAPTVDQT